ncbi:MAG TPA: chromate efflux transporter [Herpetosiphonaceae bacterium]
MWRHVAFAVPGEPEHGYRTSIPRRDESMMNDTNARPTAPDALPEVARLFFKLGWIAFGGPAAHIALMREEVVRRRRWLDDQHFLDLLGATNLIPGPNSTELAIHLGYARAGWRGLIVAGTLFILPAMTIVLALAWAYQRFGELPEATALLYGVKPVILAVVLQALWTLGRTAVKDVWLAAIGAGALALYLLGINEIGILLLAGALVGLLRLRRYGGGAQAALLMLPNAALLIASGQSPVPVSLWRLFLIFLKIGSVLYGSGYVLLAFLRSDLVLNTRWLTDQQLLDAVAIGQFTPGPVFTTATFIGYLIGGWAGAILATIGIFLPSFIFVAITNPWVPRLRRSPWASALLDGVNVASLGLMAGVTLQLGQTALVDLLTALLCLIAGVLLIRYKVNSVWLVLGGGIVGLIARWLGW